MNEDVFPIEHGGISRQSCDRFRGLYCFICFVCTSLPRKNTSHRSPTSLLSAWWDRNGQRSVRLLQGGKSMASNIWCRASVADCCWEHVEFLFCIWYGAQQKSKGISKLRQSTLHFLVIVVFWFFPGCSASLQGWKLVKTSVFSICNCFFHGSQSLGCSLWHLNVEGCLMVTLQLKLHGVQSRATHSSSINWKQKTRCAEFGLQAPFAC